MRALFYLFPMRMWSGYAFGLTSTNHFSPFRRANFFTSSIFKSLSPIVLRRLLRLQKFFAGVGVLLQVRQRSHER